MDRGARWATVHGVAESDVTCTTRVGAGGHIGPQAPSSLLTFTSLRGEGVEFLTPPGRRE